MGGFQQVMGELFGARPPIGGTPYAAPVNQFGWGGNFGAQTMTAGLWQPAGYDYRPWGLGDQSAAAFGRYWGQNSPSTPGAYILGRDVPGGWQFAPNPNYNYNTPFIGRPSFTPGGYGVYPNTMPAAPMSQETQRVTSVVSGLALLLGGLGVLK
jgi:hypothetical protein